MVLCAILGSIGEIMRLVQFAGARVVRFLGPLIDGDKVASLSHWMLLSKFLRILDIDLIIDVGANVGGFARAMRYIGYKGLIVSFEPLTAEFEIMRRTMMND